MQIRKVFIKSTWYYYCRAGIKPKKYIWMMNSSSLLHKVSHGTHDHQTETNHPNAVKMAKSLSKQYLKWFNEENRTLYSPMWTDW